MPATFRNTDRRRVMAAFEEAIPAPYDPVVSLTGDKLTVRIADPEREELTVVQCEWVFDPNRPTQPQPSTGEVAQIVNAFVSICGQYVSPPA